VPVVFAYSCAGLAGAGLFHRLAEWFWTSNSAFSRLKLDLTDSLLNDSTVGMAPLHSQALSKTSCRSRSSYPTNLQRNVRASMAEDCFLRSDYSVNYVVIHCRSCLISSWMWMAWSTQPHSSGSSGICGLSARWACSSKTSPSFRVLAAYYCFSLLKRRHVRNRPSPLSRLSSCYLAREGSNSGIAYSQVCLTNCPGSVGCRHS